MNTNGTYRLGLLTVLTFGIELLAWALMLGGWWLVEREVPAFRFDRPWMLWGMIAGPLLVLLFLLHLLWRQRALLRFASPGTLHRVLPGISPIRTLIRFLLLRHGSGFVVLALATPQFGTLQEEVKAEGIDVIVAIDVSNSMACEDLKPNRMEAARRGMARLIDQLQGDRLGIVVFAGEAFVQLPVTTDRSAAKLFLHTVGTHSVGTQGTAIGSAIDLAHRGFDLESGGGKAILVITDGENHEDDAEGAATRAREAGITVHAIGMGTAKGGPIPVRRNGQLTGFRKDREGNTVVSRLNEEMLKRIAAAGGGSYVRATDRSAGIEELVEELRSMDTTETGTYRFRAHADQFQYPLGIGLLLLLLGLTMGERATPLVRWPRLIGWRSTAPVLVALVLGGCSDVSQRRAGDALREGNVHYRAARHALADSSYAKAPGDHRVVYNRGNANHMLGQWNEAVEYFNEASTLTDSSADRSRAWYNLGNASLLRSRWADSLGKVLATDIAGIRIQGPDIVGKVRLAVHRDSLREMQRSLLLLTDSALMQGAAAYRQALRLEPEAEDARHNLTVAQALIAARQKARDSSDKDKQKDKELSERARMLLEEADRLVEQHLFREALELLRNGLEQEPSLEQRKDYMEKLNVVVQAAQAS